jgi:hypothetical protein
MHEQTVEESVEELGRELGRDPSDREICLLAVCTAHITPLLPAPFVETPGIESLVLALLVNEPATDPVEILFRRPFTRITLSLNHETNVASLTTEIDLDGRELHRAKIDWPTSDLPSTQALSSDASSTQYLLYPHESLCPTTACAHCADTGGKHHSVFSQTDLATSLFHPEGEEE